MTIRKHVIYQGRVQGVGFRYTAQGLAADFPVSGYVRNLPTGQVELAAEGDLEAVEAFLEAVAGRMARNITNVTIVDQPPEGQPGFQIRF